MHAALTGLVVTAVAAAGWGAWAYSHPLPEPIKPPELSWTQTPEHVYVHVRNRNASWVLRDQPLYVSLHADGYYVLTSYHPGDVRRLPDGESFVCCEIEYLPPHGEYTITLLPQRVEVEGVRVEARGGQGWIPMEAP